MMFFKKETKQPEVKKETLAEKYAKKFNKWRRPKPDYDAMFKGVFQRTIADVKPVGVNGYKVALDSRVRLPSLNNDIPEPIMDFYGQHGFIGWNACALLRQNPYINLACTIPAQDAIEPDYRLTYADDNKNDKEVDENKLAEIKQLSEEVYKIRLKCYGLTVNKKTFGIGLAVPIVDGADYENPLNIDGVKKGSYHGFSLIEPYWVAPQLDTEAISNPLSKDFYEPTWWQMPNGQRVHKSWCVKVVNNKVPDILKPTYYYGGVPLTQMIYERVYAAEKCANEAPQLALTKRLLVADADIENLIANPENAENIIEQLKWHRDNDSIWFKNPQDTVQQIDTTLAEFDALVMTQYQLVASIAEMPATKLLKTQPKGFNATGEYEQKDYVQTLQTIQESDFLPLLQLHNRLLTKSLYGKELKLNVVFNPVDTPSEKEVAEVAEINSRTDTNYINAGVVDASEIRAVIRNTEESRYSTLTEEMPDGVELPEAENDE